MIFEKIDAAPWIDEAERLLPFELPRHFSQFMRKYKFRGFEIKHLHHYDNYDGSDRWCWHVALTRDKSIFEICIRHGFLPIGQPEKDSNYDRLCLDVNRQKRGDCPVVQIDHESILLKQKIRIVGEPFPSYKKLIADVLVTAEEAGLSSFQNDDL